MTGQEIKKFGMIILRAGALLQSSGACTARTRIILGRISNAYGLIANVFITHRALTITLLNQEMEPAFNSTMRTGPVGVNFKIVSGISRMSMNIKQHPCRIEAITAELDKLEKLPHYPRPILLTMVSMSGAGFCLLAGGNILSMILCFCATFIGLFVRQETTKMHFNPYLCVFLAALAATLIAGGVRTMFPQSGLEEGFATSVLFLIPGVPLINSFVDLIDGNLLNGIIRLVNGLLFSFMIAMGMVCSIVIFHFN